MILIDSVIWVDHIRATLPTLTAMLDQGEVLVHNMVIGEVAMGSLCDRASVLALMPALPRAVSASDAQTLDLIERERLYSTGLSFIDAHLLASALLTESSKLWTRDKELRAQAERLEVAYIP